MEVRWFFNDEPRELIAWFREAFPKAHSEPERERQDFYLRFRGVDFAGVKLREYPAANSQSKIHLEGPQDKPTLNLEFKLREKGYGAFAFRDNVCGIVERWRKWSTALSSPVEEYMVSMDCDYNMTPEYKVDAKRVWRSVKKVRRLVKFAVKAGNVSTAPPGTRIEGGCNVELTDITTHGGNHWSFGFEAFSDNEEVDLVDTLHKTVNHVLPASSAPTLSAENSYSYPAFLERFWPL